MLNGTAQIPVWEVVHQWQTQSGMGRAVSRGCHPARARTDRPRLSERPVSSLALNLHKNTERTRSGVLDNLFLAFQR